MAQEETFIKQTPIKTNKQTNKQTNSHCLKTNFDFLATKSHFQKTYSDFEK